MAEGWPDADVLELIFLPDISTADRVTELSGRGVGLDAARKAVERIGGALDVTSEEGAGTEFEIRVPLTLTLQRVLLLQRRGETYAVPLASVARFMSRVGEGGLAYDRPAHVPPVPIEARPCVRSGSSSSEIPGTDGAAPTSLCVVLEDAAPGRARCS